jgi:hypothetical protein
MPIRHLIALIVVATTLAACGGAPVSPGGSSTPAVPTAAPAANTGAPTTVAAPTAAPAVTFEGLSTGLDNTTQARIRATSAVAGTPNADVYINGLPAVNGGKPLENIGVPEFSGWLYVRPGTYTVALVPHGGTLAQALFAPIAVNAVAGHRYTVAAMGQIKDKDIKPLVVDETALEAGIGTKPTDDVLIDLNNVSGIAGIDEQLAGSPTTAHIPYGAAQAYGCPIGRPHAITSVMGKPDSILGQGENRCEPGTSKILVHYGTYPGEGSDSQMTSELSVLDFLAGFNNYQVATDDGHVFTFNTLLAAIAKSGMRDQFVSNSPYLFFAPTDEAFAALPKAQRDTLLNDPQALTTLLKAHFVDGYYPAGSLSGASYGQTDRAVTNQLGQKLQLLQSGDSTTINGLSVMWVPHTVGNGNRVQLIDKLLPVT